jgi:hypothetical protein
MAPPAADQQEERTAFGIAFAEHGRESTLGFGAPQESRHFQSRRKPAAAHGLSGGVAFIGPQEHRGKRVPASSAAHLLERRLMPSDPADCG